MVGNGDERSVGISAAEEVAVGAAIVGARVLTEAVVVGACQGASVGDGVGSNGAGNGVGRFAVVVFVVGAMSK